MQGIQCPRSYFLHLMMSYIICLLEVKQVVGINYANYLFSHCKNFHALILLFLWSRMSNKMFAFPLHNRPIVINPRRNSSVIIYNIPGPRLPWPTHPQPPPSPQTNFYPPPHRLPSPPTTSTPKSHHPPTH